MAPVNMHDAKTRLSALVDAVENGREAEIVIARNGRPAARLVPIAAKPDTSKRIGIAKGQFRVPDDWDKDNALIQAMFENDGKL